MFIKSQKNKLNLQNRFANSNESGKEVGQNRPSGLFRNGKVLSLVLALLLTVFTSYEAAAQSTQQSPIQRSPQKPVQNFNSRDPNPLARNPNPMARYAKDRYGYTWYFDGSRWYRWTTYGWRGYRG
jgi:hypothetical protein